MIEDHTAIVDADNQQVAEVNALTTVDLSQELTDEHGEHLYQLRDGRYILKNAVTTDPELWRAALKKTVSSWLIWVPRILIKIGGGCPTVVNQRRYWKDCI
ncbi:hypothetical protein [Secundilactobacillus silagei]|uniref:hypothetical protein n=1 Tax=Secundilactobacillus silagei TaxID=1293415 RepID=UPI000A526751|nr:hypothetical protein [Secundilactobacillus silagei]